MSKRHGILALGAALLLATTPLLADSVGEAKTLLCASGQVTVCNPDGECDTKPPWTLNVPAFLVFDLEKKELRTTEASRENRSTPIRHLERDATAIYVQGVEGGRAFSFVIDVDTGRMSAAVALAGRTTTGFGTCTPYPTDK